MRAKGFWNEMYMRIFLDRMILDERRGGVMKYYICGDGITVSEVTYNLCGIADGEDVVLDELILSAEAQGIL